MPADIAEANRETRAAKVSRGPGLLVPIFFYRTPYEKYKRELVNLVTWPMS
jgi:hypothetical protein